MDIVPKVFIGNITDFYRIEFLDSSLLKNYLGNLTKVLGMKKLLFFLLLIALYFLSSGCDRRGNEPEPVNRDPIAKIVASVTEGEKPLKVEFDASLSSDPDEDELSYLWDFGNGSTSSSISPNQTFMETGTYQVTLTVSDAGGLSDSEQISIRVSEPPNIFPITENAQWVYFVKSTDLENGNISGYEEGYTYITVKNINLEYENVDFIDLRITGKKFYNKQLLGDYIFLSHVPGKRIGVKHDEGETFNNMIDLDNYTWNNFAMFFSRSNSQSVIMTPMSFTIGLGTFHGYQVKYQRDNWGENYVTERFDVMEQEFLDPEIGFIYRNTSRYVNFLDCFTCPVYGGGIEIELVGYYIQLPDGTVFEDGYGYNPANPFGGNLGQMTIWASEDIGHTEVYMDNEYVGVITNYWPDGLTCDQPRALNVSLADGSYTLTAESNKNYYWEGTVTFTEGVCETVELTLTKGGFSTKQIHLKEQSNMK